LADTRSQENNARAHAVLEAQNMAERYKMAQNPGAQDVVSTSRTGETWIQYYDDNWNDTEETPWAYCLSVQALPTESPYLGRAELVVRDRQGKDLVRIPLAWQVAQGEVSSDG
jgi:hypothetical protein